MIDGFIKVAAATPEIKVADCEFNAQSVISHIKAADKIGAKLLVFPELCLTGYTAGDLFYSDTLLLGAMNALGAVAKATEKSGALVFVGMPVKYNGAIYNCAAALNSGKILGIIPKINLPEYNEFYEKRQFVSGKNVDAEITVCGRTVPISSRLIFCADVMPEFTVAAEICEDLWVGTSPSAEHSSAGANVIVNLSASDETVGKAEYRRALVSMQSAKLVCGYVYADAGEGESTTDMVFAGHNIIAENGKVLKESVLFENSLIYSEIDVKFLSFERSKIIAPELKTDYKFITFNTRTEQTELTRIYDKRPFVPSVANELDKRAELILNIQSNALAKRIKHTNSGAAVVGVSGGLDSCLALLVCVRAMKKLNRPLSDIIAVSMPCFGTTKRTKSNAEKLAERLGVSFRTVDITQSVKRHLSDIGHDGATTDVTYENAQARERTQVLMDIANMAGGMVIGTGDLSELALGWATYNGDHMSMYGVNASVPKTLVRYIVAYEAEKAEDGELKKVLKDILATPVSPELLPAKEGEISQKTEDLVGPYDLHDFFLYCFVRCGYGAGKIYRLACSVFADEFDAATVEKWLRVFIRRFFAQQFKRSCVPDGVKVGSVALSPRGDWRMPSDAPSVLWEKDLDARVKKDVK